MCNSVLVLTFAYIAQKPSEYQPLVGNYVGGTYFFPFEEASYFDVVMNIIELFLKCCKHFCAKYSVSSSFLWVSARNCFALTLTEDDVSVTWYAVG